MVELEGNTCAVMKTLSLNITATVQIVCVYLLRARLLSITRLSELRQRNQGVSEGCQQLARMMVITFA
jgi:hypothetical protein